MLAVEVRDPREQELADVGELRLVDPETGRQLRVDTGDRRLRERFAAAASEERRALAASLASAGVGHVALSTEGDWLRPLAAFLRRGRRDQVSFTAPILLLCLLAVPAAVAALPLARPIAATRRAAAWAPPALLAEHGRAAARRGAATCR